MIRELFRKSTSSLFRRYTCLYYIIFTCFHNISVWKDICCTFFYWYFPLVGILFLDFVTSLNTVKKMLLILSPKKKNKTKQNIQRRKWKKWIRFFKPSGWYLIYQIDWILVETESLEQRHCQSIFSPYPLGACFFPDFY